MFLPLLTLALALPVPQEHDFAPREEEVAFTREGVSLAGTLFTPPSVGVHPALLFLQGSGEHDREPVLVTARRCATLGLVALAFDKRGTGRSQGDWREASLDDLAQDALAGLRFLRARADVDARRVGLWAPSQGAWVASALCARGGEPGFVIAVSGGGVAPAEAERWAYDCRLRAARASAEERAEAAAFVERYLEFLAGDGDEPSFAAALEAACTTSWWTTLELERVKAYVARRARWSWVASYDPRTDLAAMHCPVLVLLGEGDELQSSALAAQRWREGLWRGGNDDLVVHVFPGANHYLRAPGAAGADPHAGEFLPAVQAELESWLRARVLAPRTPDAPLAFVDVNLVDVELGRIVPHQSVLVLGPRILRVGPASELALPAGTRRIDGAGRFLLPGLVDAHVHAGERELPLFLANCVTTVRELNGTSEHLRLRERIASGAVLGPRMVVSSPMLAGERQRWRHVLLTDPLEAELAAERFALEGYDALKIYDGLSPEVYEALAEVARLRGLPLVGHVPKAVGLERVLAAGQELQHVEQLAEATVGHRTDLARIPEIARTLAQAGVTVTPTLAAQAILCSQGRADFLARYELPELVYVDAETRAWWDGLRGGGGHAAATGADSPFYVFQRELVRALAAAGVPLLVGTDTPNPLLVAGFSMHEECTALRAAGLAPADVLRAATLAPARALGLEREQGRVAEGLRADLVLVDANPLEDLAALRRPRGVLVAGRWLDSAELTQLLVPLHRR
ncbi:MAG: hypothetical protein EXS08_01890 [Planctomycetes bacterium]|nr:hypothetical protein [Planctomycetota bacterium]